ncbi:hypothetical protein [Bdellovibrio sp. HCB288]|uniref:hypothetical protein n=1 Tax=Bdellovibrio sp. HCB288 TaxID=3394355 RepID=UPI0039B6778B
MAASLLSMKTLLLISLMTPTFASASLMHCEYSFFGAPAGTVRIEVADDGTPAETATITMFHTPTQSAPVTPLDKNPGEMFNVVLFKDNPQNEIFMIVNTPSAEGSIKSKLINPKMSGISKEIPGACKLQ